MSNNYLPSLYQQFIYKGRYARWNEEFGRREELPETIFRYFEFFQIHLKDKYGYLVPKELRTWLEGLVLDLQVMPSMRALMTAGPALKRENMAGYNCSYLPIDDSKAFDEVLYILMNGTGVGFGVEQKHVNQLAVIPDEIHKSNTIIYVADSKEGWARALRELIALLYAGREPSFDVSKVRLAGSPLKTFGGRASGPEPLLELFRFVIAIFKHACGRKLTTLECHDIVCKIAEIVVVGGVRRSALISLSDISDDNMRSAKVGQWWINNGQRALANNSAVYVVPPDMQTFMSEWYSLYESKSGERGIFNRAAAIRQMARFGRRELDFDFGTNPCGEALLRPYQTCNLSEVIVRSTDTGHTLADKVRAAAILGTWQSTLDEFKYIRKKWSEIEQEERLLGVSLSGVFDNAFLLDHDKAPKLLSHLRELAVHTNVIMAKALGINSSVGVTLNKPSGTVSQLVDCASGCHARHSDYYIRTVRGDKKDPLTQFLIDQNIPFEDCVMQPNSTVVFSFPQKAPINSKTRHTLTAIEHLEIYKMYKENWCEHNPSITVTVREEEWLEVGAWVYKNINDVIGLTFLPHTEHTYRQAPYQDSTEEEYNKLKTSMPEVLNWDIFKDYEKEDNTVASQELACAAGFCEIV